MSQAGSFNPSQLPPGSVVETLTGNTGGAVGPNGADNINIVGDGTSVTVAGNPATHTLTISAVSTVANAFHTDSGNAIPAAGVLNIITNNALLKAGSSVLFTGSGNTVQLNITDSNANTLLGNSAGNASLTGSHNSSLGGSSFENLTSASFNVAIGFGAGQSLTGGTNNTLLGAEAGNSLTSGEANIIIGNSAGNTYADSENSNIILNSPGVSGDANILRIGSATGSGTNQLIKAFISGIRGITPATADGIPVFIGSTGQLGTVGNGGTGLISTLTGNTGGAISPVAGNINVVGDGSTITIAGTGNTLTASLVGTGAIQTLTGSTSGGAISPLAGNVNITAGTGITVIGTAHTLTISTTGTVANSFVTDSGTATPSGGVLNLISGKSTDNSGSTVYFSGSGNTATLNTTVNRCVMIGTSSGNASMVGQFNVGVGAFSGSSLTSGSNNVFVGDSAGDAITTGSGNFILGAAAGINYTSGESSNIIVGYHIFGTTGESNVMRLGNGTGTGTGQIEKSFVSGIVGITPATADGIPVFIGSTGQLGTVGNGGTALLSTLTGNTGGAISPVSGNINVVGDGTSITVAGTGNTLTISTASGVADSFPTDSGTATPTAGVLHIVGGKGIVVSGSSNIVTVASTGIFFTYIDVHSSPYTVLTDDVYLSVDSTGGPITILLPNSALVGEPYIIKDRTGTSTTNNITVTTVGGSVTIDGVTSFIMDSAYQSISLVGNGTSYEIY